MTPLMLQMTKSLMMALTLALRTASTAVRMTAVPCAHPPGLDLAPSPSWPRVALCALQSVSEGLQPTLRLLLSWPVAAAAEAVGPLLTSGVAVRSGARWLMRM